MRVGWSKMGIFASFARYIFRIFTSKATFIILCYVAHVAQRIRGFFKNVMRYINPRFTYLLTYPLVALQ